MLIALYVTFMMVLLFGATIFVHELGHFLVARRCGLVVEVFSIGMGPALWKKKIGDVVYKIGWLPIGGYVALPQLDPAGMERIQGEADAGQPALPDVEPRKKIAVAVAGPLFNVAFAFLLAGIVAAAHRPEAPAVVGAVAPDSPALAEGVRPGDRIVAVDGKPVSGWYEVRVETLLNGGDETRPVELTLVSAAGETNRASLLPGDPAEDDRLFAGVEELTPCPLGQIEPGSPAEAAGLRSGDLVRRFGGERVLSWSHFTELVQRHPDRPVEIVVERDAQPLALTVVPKFHPEIDRTLVGVHFGGVSAMPWALSGTPTEQIANDASSIFRFLKALVTPAESKRAAGGLGGPVAIFSMIWFALGTGIVNALGLIRFINVNLAILNLLPIPVLDGGHVVFALWEGITRRKPHPKLVAALVNGFAILLLGAMLLLSIRDVDRQWGIKRLFRHAPPAAEQPAEEEK